MVHPMQVMSEGDRTRFCALAGLSVLNLDALTRPRPDAMWLLNDAAGAGAARCSLWWTGTPPYGEHRLGFIGHLAIRDAAVAGPLLQLACAQLAEHGCTLAVGPLDGTTWQRYRLLTERGSEPIFFLEPDNPDDWPGYFTDNGFTAVAQYCSAVATNLAQEDARLPAIAERMAGRGIQLRSLNLDHFEEELRGIHALSLESFRDNFLYTPITEQDFVAQYRDIRPYVRPELVLIAELHGQPVGYIFAVPDLNQTRRGQPIDTVILKTMAVHPDHRSGGLGSLLLTRCQQAAGRLGYRRAIHALMHESNHSRRISSHTARIMRRYTLFARPVGPSS